MYNFDVEAMDRERLAELQLTRLIDTVRRCEESVPFYRENFSKAGVTWRDISSLRDLERFPFVTKDDLRANYPFGLLAVPDSEIVRVHASSGTTGMSTVVGYTRKDIEVWAELVARAIVSCGGDRNDIVQIAYGYGLFTGGLGLHYGVEKLGAMALPISGGNTRRQVRMITDLGVTVLCCTPSYALFIAEVSEQMGIDAREWNLKAGIFGAEPWSDEIRNRIESSLHLSAFDIFGLTEVMGPGVAVECECKDGLHIFEDSFFPEVIDPNTLEVLPYGQQGELVFTTINKFGMPLVRYRTRDITTLDESLCSCGRTHIRMKRVTGRSDDMLIIRGVNVFPSQIEKVLMRVEGVMPHYQIVVYRKGDLDMIEVQVEVSEEIFSDEIRVLENLKSVIASEIDSYLGISAKVSLVEPRTIARSEGKAVRVKDLRKTQEGLL